MADSIEQHTILRLLHRSVFCLNLGFAIALVTVVCEMRRPVAFVHMEAVNPDLFQQVLIKTNLALHRVPWDPLATNIALTSFALVLAGVLFLLLLLIDKTGGIEHILTSGAGIAGVAAVPIAWLPYKEGIGRYFLVDPRAWYAVVLEFALVGGALYLSRRQPNPSWFIVLLAHYGIWSWFLLEGTRAGYAGPLVACRRVTITRLFASKLSWPLAVKSCSPNNSIPT